MIGSNNSAKIKSIYAKTYNFEELDRTANGFNDFQDVVVLYKFSKLKKQIVDL